MDDLNKLIDALSSAHSLACEHKFLMSDTDFKLLTDVLTRAARRRDRAVASNRDQAQALRDLIDLAGTK